MSRTFKDTPRRMGKMQSSVPPSRSPSPPHGRRNKFKASPSQENIVDIFECPICMDYVLPPILQCENGHLVCGDCRDRLISCPTCRGPLGRTRNLALEKIADLTNFPCKYKVVGCTYSFPPQEKLAHEKKCNYRQFKCPCPGSGCKWSDSKEKVVQHLANAHPSIVTLQGEDIIFLATEIDMAASMDWVMMQSCFGHHFLLVLQKQYQDPHSQYYIQVIMMGSKNEAKHFRYNLQLHAGSRKLNFQSAPKSLDDVNTADVFRKECLHFDSHLAMLFVRENNLNIAVRISVNSGDQDD